MGNQKQKWTADEEDALHRGVQKYGAGKWKNILKDPDFAPFLTSRSNIDLKDKWRNLNVSNGQGIPKDKSRTPKPKSILPPPSLPAPASVIASVPIAVSAPQNVVSVNQDKFVDDLTNAEDSKNPSRYNAMVFEALSTIKDVNGSDVSAILSFIEQKHQVPSNFKRALSTRLKRLVNQGKLEKVQNGYIIKKDAPSVTKSPSPSPKPKDAWPRQSSASSILSCSETAREAAATAAYRIAEAENKAFLAAEAFKEVDRLSQMAEDNEIVLRLATQMYEQSLRGDIVLLD
ncbi:hypothetical protein TanjilG_30042 [Lupinus angustifolius]|uniref:MYB transcription factor n=1 Tax=Lupinus angustifolius TaxID=3871 RepID=A0A4P1R6N2_LUPAN|nr:PREDICTED: telomere repeat-binding factor 4-like [Lupinus angustifolius]OIW03766.1 hypothetical protein TanjilG_30042 [Lupinus angustifolius]